MTVIAAKIYACCDQFFGAPRGADSGELIPRRDGLDFNRTGRHNHLFFRMYVEYAIDGSRHHRGPA